MNYNADSNSAVIDVTDEIGFFGISHKDIKAQLDEVSDADIHLNIASFGGNVSDAMAIYNMLKSHKGTVTAKVFGDSASAATLIALAADKVEMADNVFFLIHNVWTMAVGDSGELRKVAETMDKVNDQIVNIYMQKTGRSESTIRKWMENEDWWSAKEAKSKGFVDKIVEPANIMRNAALMNCADERIKNKLIYKLNNKQMEEKSLLEKIWDKVSKVEVKEEEQVEETPVTETEEFKNALDQVQDGLASKIAELQNSFEAQLAEKEAKLSEIQSENEKLKASKTDVIGNDDSPVDGDSEKKEKWRGSVVARALVPHLEAKYGVNFIK